MALLRQPVGQQRPAHTHRGGGAAVVAHQRVGHRLAGIHQASAAEDLHTVFAFGGGAARRRGRAFGLAGLHVARIGARRRLDSRQRRSRCAALHERQQAGRGQAVYE
ncbi:hypothetical protein SDC9_118296 [bioreactor metagenome]|uniref:Uncharacterized protein n=1 Tax=bioreactor metagenome TaxID=1076179 RepID=A0A645C143_9ZZZZ